MAGRILPVYETGRSPEKDEHTEYLEDIRSRLTYRKWFGGHFHMDRQLTEKDILLYEQIVRIL